MTVWTSVLWKIIEICLEMAVKRHLVSLLIFGTPSKFQSITLLIKITSWILYGPDWRLRYWKIAKHEKGHRLNISLQEEKPYQSPKLWALVTAIYGLPSDSWARLNSFNISHVIEQPIFKIPNILFVYFIIDLFCEARLERVIDGNADCWSYFWSNKK